MTASDAMNTLSTSLLNHVGCAPPRSVTTVTNGSSRLQQTKHGRPTNEHDRGNGEGEGEVAAGALMACGG